MPSFLNGLLYYRLRVLANFDQFFFEDLNVPPRAGGILARLVGITRMLELQVKTKPVHLLEGLVGVSVDNDRLLATSANFVFAHDKHAL